jgi:hypothetical protein
VTFTATVSNISALITPGGSVQFTIDGAPYGSPVTLSGNTASVVDSALSLGSHAVTAAYTPANGDFLASSGVLTQAVKLNLGLLVLDPTGKDALTATGNASIVVNDVVSGTDLGAGIVVDSDNAETATATGNASVSAKYIEIVGGAVATEHGTYTSPVNHNFAPMSDPAGLPLPPAPSTTFQGITVSGNSAVTLQPGTYIGGIKITGNGSVTLAPGLYYMEGGGFWATGKGSVTGDGALIVNAPGGAGDALNFTGQGTVTLRAPTNLTGAYAPYNGLVIFQDPASTVAINVTGQAKLSLTGTLYAPRASLNITGNGIVATAITNSPANPIGAVIVADLDVTGNGLLSITVNEGLPAASGSSVGSISGVTGKTAHAVMLASQGSASGLSAWDDQTVLNDVAASLVLVGGNDSGPNAKKPKK